MTSVVRRRLVVVGLLVSGGLALTPVWAQAPSPLTCEDHLLADRVNLNATTLSQVRERVEASREIARLMKEVETLRAALAAVTKKPEEKK